MAELHLARVWQFYAGFAVLCALLLLAPMPLGVGARVLLLVVAWNLLLPGVAIKFGYSRWLQLWLFLVPLSALMVLADWFFCDGIRTLKFFDNGSPRIGPVPLYMAGMWSIGLFLLVIVGQSLAWTHSFVVGLIGVAVAAVAIFLPTEILAFHLPLWSALRVSTVLNVAHYILPAEILLALITFVAYDRLQDASRIAQLCAAGGITLAYTGAAGISYLFLA